MQLAIVTSHPYILVEHLIPKPWALIWIRTPFVAVTASTLLGRLTSRFSQEATIF
uniref:Uncharacterized protein n=1 Tax=Anguilla anguilla TaxID=7936 RepID=A0A0E9S8S3_ANGAN